MHVLHAQRVVDLVSQLLHLPRARVIVLVDTVTEPHQAEPEYQQTITSHQLLGGKARIAVD